MQNFNDPLSDKQLDNVFHQLIVREPNLFCRVRIRCFLDKLGIEKTTANVDRVEVLRSQHASERSNRVERRAAAHLGYTPRSAHIPARPRLALPSGTPAERIAQKRKKTILALAKDHFRWGAAGGTSHHLEFTRAHDEVGYSVAISQNRSTYRGQFKGWKATEDHHLMKLPLNWLSKIYHRDLESFGGLMTLDANLVEQHADGVRLYAAVWAAQGRGYTVKTERGFLALGHGHHYHAESADKALKGLRRKLKNTNAASRGSALDIDDDAFIGRYAKLACELSIDDARESGSCESGILAWCETVGIDPARQSIPLREALEAFGREPLDEVRLAILHAVRRHRQAKRTALAHTQ